MKNDASLSYPGSGCGGAVRRVPSGRWRVTSGACMARGHPRRTARGLGVGRRYPVDPTGKRREWVRRCASGPAGAERTEELRVAASGGAESQVHCQPQARSPCSPRCSLSQVIFAPLGSIPSFTLLSPSSVTAVAPTLSAVVLAAIEFSDRLVCRRQLDGTGWSSGRAD